MCELQQKEEGQRFCGDFFPNFCQTLLLIASSQKSLNHFMMKVPIPPFWVTLYQADGSPMSRPLICEQGARELKCSRSLFGVLGFPVQEVWDRPDMMSASEGEGAHGKVDVV